MRMHALFLKGAYRLGKHCFGFSNFNICLVVDFVTVCTIILISKKTFETSKKNATFETLSRPLNSAIVTYMEPKTGLKNKLDSW